MLKLLKDLLDSANIKNKFGKFHDEWLTNKRKITLLTKKQEKKFLRNNSTFRNTKRSMIKQLVHYPKLYYAKSHYPLEISQRAFNHLWRICKVMSYGVKKLIKKN